MNSKISGRGRARRVEHPRERVSIMLWLLRVRERDEGASHKSRFYHNLTGAVFCALYDCNNVYIGAYHEGEKVVH